MSCEASSSKSKSIKRRRSRSREGERHKHRRTRVTKQPKTQLDQDFSFEHYKRYLNKIILYSSESNSVANNLDDFWIFLKRYEATLRKAGKPVVPPETDDSTGHLQFSKFHCINFSTKMKFVDSYDEREKKRLDKNLFDAFLNIVSVYLDFKNKEKFDKLKKLRLAQKELPVAKYR